MEDEVWSFGLSSASSRSYQSTHKSQPEFFIEIDDFDGDEDLRLDFPCPFCSEDFDLLGLCYHIDEEHHSEPKSGVCPVCAARVGKNMVGHITTQHMNILKGNQKLNPHKGDFSALSLSRKELQDGHFRSVFGGPSALSPVSTSIMALDPLLSFLHHIPAAAHKSDNLQPTSSSEVSLEEEEEEEEEEESSKPALLESVNDSPPPPLSTKDQEEKAQRCKFIQGLLLSTFLDDDL